MRIVAEKFEHCKEIMRQRGYTLHSFNPSKVNSNYTKGPLNSDGLIIHATVRLSEFEDTVQLSFMVGFMELKTTEFAFDHSRFTDLFEEQLTKGALVLMQAFPEKFSGLNSK